MVKSDKASAPHVVKGTPIDASVASVGSSPPVLESIKSGSSSGFQTNKLKPPTSELSQSEITQRRRGSSVGNINVGDNSPALSTMYTSKSLRNRSASRLIELKSDSNSDYAILKKIVLGFDELSYRHTWIKPLIVLAIVFATFYLSSPESKTHQFLLKLIVPSYKIEGTDQYGKGRNDFYFVGFYALVFTFFREFTMCCVLRPLAKILGLKKDAKIKRFMEQGYLIVYYGIFAPIGLYIMHDSPLWWFETTAMYETYPHFTHDLLFKTYYLAQAAFWVQESAVLALQLEKPRKDFYELVLHHIITIALIWCSYRFHFTWLGLLIFVTMDVSDLFLSLSKAMNYLDSILTGPFLVMFFGTWVYFRHYINLRILWSVLTDFKTVGDYTLNWETQHYKCYISQPIVFFLILALQLVNMYWLFLICRIVWRYVVVGVVEDERSDSEDEGEGKSD